LDDHVHIYGCTHIQHCYGCTYLLYYSGCTYLRCYLLRSGCTYLLYYCSCTYLLYYGSADDNHGSADDDNHGSTDDNNGRLSDIKGIACDLCDHFATVRVYFKLELGRFSDYIDGTPHVDQSVRHNDSGRPNHDVISEHDPTFRLGYGTCDVLRLRSPANVFRLLSANDISPWVTISATTLDAAQLAAVHADDPRCAAEGGVLLTRSRRRDANWGSPAQGFLTGSFP